MLLQNQNLAANLTGLAGSSYLQDPVRIAQTQGELAREPRVAALALQRMGAVTSANSVRELLRSSGVSANRDSDILRFTVTDRRQAHAAGLATAYAQAYVQYRRRLDTAALSRAIAEASRRLVELQQSGGANSTLYASLQDKQETLQTMQALQTSNASLVRAGSAVQTSPKPVRYTLFAAIAGLMVGLGMVFVRDALDTRVRTGEQLSVELGLPLLGQIPGPPRRVRTGGGLVMLSEPSSPGADSVRVLKTNLDFVVHQARPLAILVTSALPGEGKSTTACNLALAFARVGAKTALIDLDLRSPSVHELFGVSAEPGISDVAIGRVDPVAGSSTVPIVSVGDDLNARRDSRSSIDGAAGKLRIFPCGTIPAEPGTFAQSQALRDALSQLQGGFDIFIIDAPPLMVTGDALSLIGAVDYVLLVCGPKLLRRDVIRRLRGMMQTSPARWAGFVMTGASAAAPYGYSGTDRTAATFASSPGPAQPQASEVKLIQ